MRADHVFKVVDIHCGGMPTRLVLSGTPRLVGATPMEKMRYFAEHHDWIRPALVLEPRGRGMTSAVILSPPSDPDADISAFFMEAHGYLPMCGSDTISTVTALVETGQVAATEPLTSVKIETPAGLIEASADVQDGRVTSVTFTGAPAFCAVAGQTVHLPEWGPVTLDIAYGGNFYAIVDAAPFDLRLGTDTTGRAVELAHQIRNAVNATVDVVHPLIPGIRGVTHVQLFNQPKRADDPTPMMVVLPTGVVDRSPCGTGTTAKVATLLSRGQLDLDQPFVHQSITGARFTGRAVEAKTENGLSTCRVAITGSAYIVADSTVFLDTSDPLANGYELS